MTDLSMKGRSEKVTRLNSHKTNKKFLKFEQEVNASNRIEKVKKELNKMIRNNNGILLDQDIIEMSQYLDRLLVVHIRTGSDENEREEKRL